jgi:Zn-dependent peptidase ImmA (M78 family)/transcriptional regulator with XRE-family HTH domain
MNVQGVDSFTPSRLLIARERRGFTQRRLSELAGVSPRALKGYESGENNPSREALRSLAAALGYPVAFFEGPDIDRLPLDAASFRALSKASARLRNQAVACGTFAVELLYPYLEHRFSLPRVDLPDLRDETPGGAASSIRHYWGLGQRPIPHVVRLLELHGVRVFSLSEDCDAIDAFSLWRDGTPFIFLNTRKTAERSIWDASHELGHLLLHRHGVPQGHNAESEADKFASNFLLPEAAIRASAPMVPTVDMISAMKVKWKASTAAIGRRLYDLGLMTKYNYTKFNIDLSHRGRKNEPRPIPRETSAILEKTFAQLSEEGVDLRTVANELALPISEIRSLTFGLQIVEGSRVGDGVKRGNLRLVTD